MKINKQIDDLIADLKEKSKQPSDIKPGEIKPVPVVNKKELMKKVMKITAKLNQSGEKIKRFLTTDEKEKWYCFTCQKKQPIDLPRIIVNRNKEDMLQGECSVCKHEIFKKVRR